MVQSKFHMNKGGGRGARRAAHPPAPARHDFGDAALSSVDQIKGTVSRSIIERPLESVLIAAGLGILCGRFRRSPMVSLFFSAGAGLAAGFFLARRKSPMRR